MTTTDTTPASTIAARNAGFSAGRALALAETPAPMDTTHTLTRLSVNPLTGMTTHRVPAAAVTVLDAWHGRPAEQVARHGRRAPKAGTLTFRHGGGYDVIDADLLGGRGDGETRRRFEAETGHRITY